MLIFVLMVKKKKKKKKMSNTVDALARIKAVATLCTNRQCVLHCQLLTAKERREGRKEDGRKEGKEGRKDGGKKGMKELILFENILDEAITIIFSFKLNLTF